MCRRQLVAFSSSTGERRRLPGVGRLDEDDADRHAYAGYQDVSVKKEAIETGQIGILGPIRPSAPARQKLRSGRDLRADRIELGADARGEHRHRAGNDNADEGGKQRVLDEVLAFGFTNEARDQILHNCPRLNWFDLSAATHSLPALGCERVG
jgi:hypothetical protein